MVASHSFTHYAKFTAPTPCTHYCTNSIYTLLHQQHIHITAPTPCTLTAHTSCTHDCTHTMYKLMHPFGSWPPPLHSNRTPFLPHLFRVIVPLPSPFIFWTRRILVRIKPQNSSRWTNAAVSKLFPTLVLSIQTYPLHTVVCKVTHTSCLRGPYWR